MRANPHCPLVFGSLQVFLVSYAFGYKLIVNHQCITGMQNGFSNRYWTLIIYIILQPLPTTTTPLNFICEPGVDLLGMTFCPQSTRLNKETSLCCKNPEEVYCAPPLELANDGIACPDTHPYDEVKELCCGSGMMLIQKGQSSVKTVTKVDPIAVKAEKVLRPSANINKEYVEHGGRFNKEQERLHNRKIDPLANLNNRKIDHLANLNNRKIDTLANHKRYGTKNSVNINQEYQKIHETRTIDYNINRGRTTDNSPYINTGHSGVGNLPYINKEHKIHGHTIVDSISDEEEVKRSFGRKKKIHGRKTNDSDSAEISWPLSRRKKKRKHRNKVEENGFDCEDFALPGRESDCPYRRNLCHNHVFHSIMKSQCPKSCGYCNKNIDKKETVIYTRVLPEDWSEEIECMDKEKEDGTSECTKNKVKCLTEPFVHFMQQECPVTCGYCKWYMKRRKIPKRVIEELDYDYMT
ncbi:unnamed protein product [Bursaphelenchus okinawaensis]|uniref:ShKT domain-containing protein n=1 Tax=Bursaphelenchus okinawaensis TaxID=465554 RepID=A0A811KYN4_9BILA|nr:unnamed protein product [Bursaphelenchus okinawaensis]CAG9114375.1 unnamed protein product [Bursaphelenchus okinawaensis]